MKKQERQHAVGRNAFREIQGLIHDFHEVVGAPTCLDAQPPRVVDAPFRSKLITEEYQEVIEAIRSGNLPHITKELCDLIYVCLGAAETFGVDLAPVFLAVHESNMAKAGGPVREDGKQLKPEGWAPPDVEGELKKQGWRP